MSGGEIAGMILNPIGSLISSGINAYYSEKNTEATNRANAEIAAQNRALQKEFAQNSIQWKVNDAKQAGLHPLAAIGAQGTSYTPVHQEVQTPRTNFDIDFSQTASILANYENQKANTELQNAQTDYWRAMAKQVKDSNKGIAGQNSDQMSGLVGSLKSEKSNGDNIKAFALNGDEIKQPLQDHAGENPFMHNQRTLAKGIIDGTIDYDKVDEYLTAFGPGVVTTNGDTVMDAFWDTLSTHFKNFNNKLAGDSVRALNIIRNSNRPFSEKIRAIKKILSGDLSLFD